MHFLAYTTWFCLLSQCAFAQKPIIDEELRSLAGNLGVQAETHSKRKITVLDFTDLHGDTSALGKYIAEELTVNLVNSQKGLVVLDRANLRSLLADQKLQASDLLNPENAMKFGKVTGIDAMVIGTVIPKGDTIALTAKIVSTDTAAIISAERAEFRLDDHVKALVATTGKARPGTKLLDDLEISLESFKTLPGTDSYGYVLLTLILTNHGTVKAFGLCFPRLSEIHLTNNRGEEYEIHRLEGIEVGDINQNSGALHGTLSEIRPGQATTIVMKGMVRWTSKPGDFRPYRIQAVLVFGPEENGGHPNLRKYNWLMDIP